MRTVRGRRGGGVAARWIGFVPALLFFPLVGCGDPSVPEGYDPAMRYAPRGDRLVFTLPPLDPPGWDPAGKMDDAIAGLDALGGKTVDPKALERRKELEAALESLFGTPAAPTLDVPAATAGLGGLDLSPDHLAAGSRVYRRLCNQCHGVTGDGRGPTGPYVFPHPRDVRQGMYKVAAGGGKPTVESLVRQVRSGVPNTSMQPFDLIPEADVRASVAYTIHLSIRGEVEFRVLRGLAADDVDDVSVACRAEAAKVFDDWVRAQAVPTPTSTADGPDSVRRGHRLFTDQTTGCVKCHQDYGRRDAFKYTVWGTPARVSDLTRGEFRWGKQPADLAARIRHGIPAVGMPANPTLTDREVADLANFVRDLGYPQRLPPDVREVVYPAVP